MVQIRYCSSITFYLFIPVVPRRCRVHANIRYRYIVTSFLVFLARFTTHILHTWYILHKAFMCDFALTTMSGNGAHVQVTSSLSSGGDVFVLDRGD